MKKSTNLFRFCISVNLLLSTISTMLAQNWSVLGNSGINPTLHFLGTTDNLPLLFRVNNQRAGQIDPSKTNTFFGFLTDGAASTGQSNTAIGNHAMSANTSGSKNTALGKDALLFNTTGSENTACGVASLSKNTIGVWNTAIGHGALFSSTTAYANTAVGDLALTSNLSGVANTGIGEDALRRNTTGTGNSALGENALNFNISGSNNTGLGRSTSITNFSNATAVGYAATANANNKIRLGNANITSLESQVNLTVTSDRRFKKDFKEDVSGLDFILRLRPMTYRYDIHALNDFYGVNERIRAEASKGGESQQRAALELAELEERAQSAEQIRYSGFVAQEVEEAAAEIGYDFSGVYKPQNEKDNYGLRYAEFTVPLVKAVQEQQVILEKQAKQLEELQALVQDLRTQTSLSKGTENPSDWTPLSISPNPSKGMLVLEGNLRNDSDLNISIFDQQGKLVQTEALGMRSAGLNIYHLDLQKLPNGIYFLHTIMDGKVISKPLVLCR